MGPLSQGAVGGYALDLARERGWQVEGLARDSDAEFVGSTGARLRTSVEPVSHDAVLDAAYRAAQESGRRGRIMLRIG